MQINLVSNLNFGKNGTIGKMGGRVNSKRRPNPLNSKYEKLMERYKKEIPIVYNTFSHDKQVAKEELNSLYAKFILQTDILRGRRFTICNAKDI